MLTWPKTQLVIEPPLPGRLSATTPEQTFDDDLEHIAVPVSRPMRFVDLDDPFAACTTDTSGEDDELYLVRQHGHIQVVDLHRFPAHYPRHPLHDSIMCRVLAADDGPSPPENTPASPSPSSTIRAPAHAPVVAAPTSPSMMHSLPIQGARRDSTRSHEDEEDVDVLSLSYKQRLAVADLQKRALESRLAELEAQLATVKLQNAVLTKRLNEPDLML